MDVVGKLDAIKPKLRKLSGDQSPRPQPNIL